MQKESVEYTDDLDGEPIEEGLVQTFRFAVDDIDYEIDLRPVHAERFRADTARWIAAATRDEAPAVQERRHTDHLPSPAVSPNPAASTPRVTSRDRYQLAAVRHWAKGQGIAVSSRGRVPRHVLERFDAAHAR